MSVSQVEQKWQTSLNTPNTELWTLRNIYKMSWAWVLHIISKTIETTHNNKMALCTSTPKCKLLEEKVSLLSLDNGEDGQYNLFFSVSKTSPLPVHAVVLIFKIVSMKISVLVGIKANLHI